MKGHRVYWLLLVFTLLLAFTTTSCARKSGCHAIEQTTKPTTKKNPKAQQHLFGKKMRRKVGGR